MAQCRQRFQVRDDVNDRDQDYLVSFLSYRLVVNFQHFAVESECVSRDQRCRDCMHNKRDATTVHIFLRCHCSNLEAAKNESLAAFCERSDTASVSTRSLASNTLSSSSSRPLTCQEAKGASSASWSWRSSWMKAGALGSDLISRLVRSRPCEYRLDK